VYNILLESQARRDLRRLPKSVFERTMRQIGALASNPRPAGCRKIVGSENDWRVRVGDYRVVYEIHDPDRMVRVMFVRHRREAYR